MKPIKLSTIILFIVFLLTGCDKGFDNPDTIVTDSFESGSIGKTEMISENEWELYIADDNDNPDLPDSWRCWWYFKIENLSKWKTTTLTIKNSGWPYYYVPVYSYDQKEWLHFSEEEVTQNAEGDIILNKKFKKGDVWIARFYPYTFSDLEIWLKSIENKPFVEIQKPGYSQEGKPVYLIKITDSETPSTNKKRIFMHARTHSAEVPPSFLIEGLVDFLLSGSTEAREILSDFEFYIFPMQNVDGAIAGNYRSTPKSENLEMMWNYDFNNTLELIEGTPPEVTVVHQYAKNLMSDGGPRITIALNLHSSNSEPEICPFFFPHFGSEANGYQPAEASLWNNQLRFINTLTELYVPYKIEPVIEDGGGSFATKTYPESWWWVNFKDSVMAMTFELTYGKAGYNRWVKPDDYRNLGQTLAMAIRDYHDETYNPAAVALKSSFSLSGLKYPDLYPPAAKDELKE